jgi:hypothetical protein
MINRTSQQVYALVKSDLQLPTRLCGLQKPKASNLSGESIRRRFQEAEPRAKQRIITNLNWLIDTGTTKYSRKAQTIKQNLPEQRSEPCFSTDSHSDDSPGPSSAHSSASLFSDSKIRPESKVSLTYSLLRDPITNEIMIDPVTCNDGRTYDRSTVEKLGGRSPFTREPIAITGENLAVRSVIFDKFPELQTKYTSRKEPGSSKAPSFSSEVSQVNRTADSRRFPVTLITYNGDQPVLEVSPSTTIRELKEEVCRATNTPARHQRLISRGKQLLDNDKTLADYNIQTHSNIFLVRPLCGGKPVILLYPNQNQPIECSIKVNLKPTTWNFSAIYPQDGSSLTMTDSFQWNVTAHPDGTLTYPNGKEYSYLFWEAETLSDCRLEKTPFRIDNNRSFCVKGSNAADFLDEALKKMGLNTRERNDMVTYWLPQLEANQWSQIQFLSENEYKSAARLEITPKPDTMLRVFMLFKGVSEEMPSRIKIEDIQTTERKGFTAIEWGAMNLGSNESPDTQPSTSHFESNSRHRASTSMTSP